MLEPDAFDARTRQLVGEAGIAALARSHILVVGLGGVGSFAAESLVRAGIGRLTLLDHDRVAPSNLNRQLLALHSTLGQPKVTAMAARIADINPHCQLDLMATFLRPEDVPTLLTTTKPSLVLDCIDTIVSKAALVRSCQQLSIPIASSMGAGGRLDATRVAVSTLAKTQMCPLARALRKRLRLIGASAKYPVVYSDEPPIKGTSHHPPDPDGVAQPRSTNGSIAYLPGMMGLMLAGLATQHCLTRAEAPA